MLLKESPVMRLSDAERERQKKENLIGYYQIIREGQFFENVPFLI